jgi:alkanesulfonate monooxygenase SsuD/methylene tetrahydromethanopterin reductase-like flavin-dependent oxidoreductase (luciferase family)
MFVARFDLRTPDPSMARDLYAAAIDMAEWSDRNGALAIVVSEHHGVADGFLPSPLLLAAAMAARTSTVNISVAALLLPFHDPVRLAEDMAVLHRISGGRTSYVLGLGYRPEEYELHGVPWAGRGALFEERLVALLDALRSDAVTPTEPGVLDAITCGGRSVAMARRAGRLGLGLFAQTDDPALAQAHAQAAADAGVPAGPVFLPSDDAPYALFVADDVDRAWDELGPHLLHDAVEYASWNPGATTASFSQAGTVDELRAANASHRIVDVEGAVELLATDGFLALHPLCGGIPPEIAWPYLRRVADEVIPAA